ncbi:DoxX family protein [Kangiella sediminilitoris]|uniref:DoxX family protein n=1 Tax=Kangiella sediminilitoris TaxID=1144748 RepID=A0A1B3BDR0_9GAMM|nr:DoxX family protein [Kangiella sediminilitoris]AOE50908.1 hypothetical protein KS2013_2203 [Kangiella sediminilitoris]
MKSKVVVLILLVIFLVSGSAKLMGLNFELEAFTRWGYPIWFMYLVGFIEIAAVVLLLIPKVSSIGSLVMAGVMAGAIATHMMHHEWLMLIVALAILVLTLYRTYLGREKIQILIERSLSRR